MKSSATPMSQSGPAVVRRRSPSRQDPAYPIPSVFVFQPAAYPPPTATLLPEENRIELENRAPGRFAGEDAVERILRGGQTFVIAPQETAEGVGERPRVHTLENIVVPRGAMVEAPREVMPEEGDGAGIVVVNEKHTDDTALGDGDLWISRIVRAIGGTRSGPRGALVDGASHVNLRESTGVAPHISGIDGAVFRVDSNPGITAAGARYFAFGDISECSGEVGLHLARAVHGNACDAKPCPGLASVVRAIDAEVSVFKSRG